MWTKLMTAWMAALVLTVGLSAAAFAQADGVTPANPNAPQLAWVDADGDGVCDNYVDADGDGIHDGALRRGPQSGPTTVQGMGTQQRLGDGTCGDCPTGGIPPQDGTGKQLRRGGQS